MTTIMLIGVLATLASYGVRKYVSHSKTAEASNTIGGIGAAANAAFYHERMDGSTMQAGSSTTSTMGWTTGGGSKGKGATHTHHPGLCDDSLPVPLSITSVQGQKYQPSAQDYTTGDAESGWQCLLFSNDSPQYYQYQFLSTGHTSIARPHGMGPPPGQAGIPATSVWTAVARGDLDGNGVLSYLALSGAIDNSNQFVVAPALDIIDEDE